jgi:hypothetical protein
MMDIHKLLEHPEVLPSFLKSIWEQITSSPSRQLRTTADTPADNLQMTSAERANFEKEILLLKKNPNLVGAVFLGGVRDLIADGRTTITALNDQPKELLDILRNGRMKGAIVDGTVTIGQLTSIPPEILKEADQLLFGNIDIRYEDGRNSFRKATELLRMDEKQAEAFRMSIDKTEKRWDQERQTFGPQVTPGNSVVMAADKTNGIGSIV